MKLEETIKDLEASIKYQKKRFRAGLLRIAYFDSGYRGADRKGKANRGRAYCYMRMALAKHG